MNITTKIKLLALSTMLIVVGCNKDNKDPGPTPTVSTTTPASSAVGVERKATVTASFSAAMNPTTITASTFTLMNGTTAVPGTVTYSGTTATFTPTSMLDASTVYTATISSSAKSSSGASLAADKVWSFTTVGLPAAGATDPLDNATAVSLSKVVAITFSVAMDPLTITSSTFMLKQGTTAVAGAVAYSGTTATFTPTTALAPNTVYTATVTTGAKNIAGDAIAANKVWSFTTVPLPEVSSTDPLNGAVGVAQNKVVAVTFSKIMDPLTITTSTFTLKQGTTSVAGAVAYSVTTATFTPTTNLSSNTVYTATVTTGAKDGTGNAIATSKVWSFTTDASPDVNSTDPLNNATGVASNKVVAVTFSKAMNASTITASTFTLTQGTTSVAGTVAYSGTTATFTPTNNLLVSTVYTATVTTGAKDVAGNALAANKVWSFTTSGSSGTGLAAVNLGSAINYVVLAKTAITNISSSAVTGDLGLSPAATSYVTGLSLTNATGYATSAQVTGKIYAADMADPTPINLTTAVNDMITAYTDAAGRPTPDFSELGTGNIGGMTLTPGLYKWTNTVTMPSDVTISGSSTAVWIFQIAGDLSMSNAVHITLIGGAQAKNIFWQVAGTATLGTTSHFEGIILSQTAVTVQTGASFHGRALAQTAVVLDGNAVTQP